MPQFLTIPKHILPRSAKGYEQKIPKIIWQTFKTDRVSALIKSYADSWITLNPEYEYRLFDDNDILVFIKNEFPDYLEGYQKLKYGASKADLWRYLIIYKYGGVYADMDCKCLTPLREWLNPNSSFITQLGTNKDICQWLIISIPQNPIFLKAAQKTIQNSKNENYKTFHYGFSYSNNKISIRNSEDILSFSHPVLGLSGPPVLQSAAEECFIENCIPNIFSDIQIVCVSGSKVSCQMNGNVIHDTQNTEYKRALKKLKIIHYNRRTEKGKRKIFFLFQLFKRSQPSSS